jgi:hypothetical protein
VLVVLSFRLARVVLLAVRSVLLVLPFVFPLSFRSPSGSLPLWLPEEPLRRLACLLAWMPDCPVDEKEGAVGRSFWPSAPSESLNLSVSLLWLASGLGWPSDAFVSSRYGIGGEVGSAKVAGCWSQPVHTGATAIVTMVGMAMVVMVVVAVMSDGTSSGVFLRGPSLSRALW